MLFDLASQYREQHVFAVNRLSTFQELIDKKKQYLSNIVWKTLKCGSYDTEVFAANTVLNEITLISLCIRQAALLEAQARIYWISEEIASFAVEVQAYINELKEIDAAAVEVIRQSAPNFNSKLWPIREDLKSRFGPHVESLWDKRRIVSQDISRLQGGLNDLVIELKNKWGADPNDASSYERSCYLYADRKMNESQLGTMTTEIAKNSDEGKRK